MTELDPLAPAVSAAWAHENVTVVRRPGGPLRIERIGDHIAVDHCLSSADIGERLVADVTAGAVSGALSQREFELVMVGLVRSTIDDPTEAWTTYYRNSLDELISGAADFAPIHARAESLVLGSVLDLGSCFGFFPLRLAATGRDVTATDLSAGTMSLLGTVAPHLGITIETLVCDAAHVPVPGNSADTVTALHLLEHVDPELGTSILREAIRIARRRVVVAVPFEDAATACHGHVRTFDADALRHLGDLLGLPFEVAEHHGGWLTIETAAVPQSV